LEEECSELRLNIQQMDQVTEEGHPLVHNSIHLLLHEKEKLNDDLQITLQGRGVGEDIRYQKRTLTATGGKHKLRRPSRSPPGRE
jgi:hypothetical protein